MRTARTATMGGWLHDGIGHMVHTPRADTPLGQIPPRPDTHPPGQTPTQPGQTPAC